MNLVKLEGVEELGQNWNLGESVGCSCFTRSVLKLGVGPSGPAVVNVALKVVTVWSLVNNRTCMSIHHRISRPEIVFNYFLRHPDLFLMTKLDDPICHHSWKSKSMSVTPLIS